MFQSRNGEPQDSPGVHGAGPPDEKVCACCGDHIRLLNNHEQLSLFLSETALQQRAFQCANCGCVVCYACKGDAACCICRSNAWIAMPCLDGPKTGPDAYVSG